MFKCVEYKEVKSDISKMMKRKSLIPVIGSGFTRGCEARKLKVPSGEDYKEYMINKIIEKNSTEIKKGELEKEKFSEISMIYHKVVEENKQHTYLIDSFTKVKLDNNKKDFLTIDWPYIYTLNIDDAIENNSEYKTVIYSNREIRDNIFDYEKCVIKLHGDITEMLSYKDSKSEIFDQKQYVTSINSNQALLKKLTHDYDFLNLIYIGCSLSDEIDLLFSSSESKDNNNVRYYCTVEEPSYVNRMKLENYGITHCIVFDSYDEIYGCLRESYIEALKILPDDLTLYNTYKFTELSEGFDNNKAYLFQGKSLLDKSGNTTFPNFFVSREKTDEILDSINTKGTQIIIGSGCSGKTYLAFDVVKRVRDKEVFLFRTRDRINRETFEELLRKDNCLVICDSKVLSSEQIEAVLKSTRKRLSNNNTFLIIENKSNRDLATILDYYLKVGELKEEDILRHELENRFTKVKTDEINKLLVKSSLGVFSEKNTLADNLIRESDKLNQKNMFSKTSPSTNTVREVASLIVLAIKGKIYASDAVVLDLVEELEGQCRKAAPLIEKENTWSFEISAANNSPQKYVVNAEYWLYDILDKLSRTKQGRKNIIEAYQYIVRKLIAVKGEPDLLQNNKNSSYKDYILFDNIFQVFSSQGTSLIREIFESLSNMLSTDPNYLHQRAKCLIRSAYKTKDDDKKINWLESAYRDAINSNSIFEKRYDNCQNEKIMISAAHALYTAALSECHIAKFNNYKEISLNRKAVDLLYKALISPYNSIEFVNSDRTYNYNNVVKDIITTFLTDDGYLNDKHTMNKLEELLIMFMDSGSISN